MTSIYQVNVDLRMGEKQGYIVSSLLACPDESRVALHAPQVDVQLWMLKQELHEVVIVA
jgi:hypothetical protein